MTTAVILNLAQAKLLSKLRPAADDVFSFCPSATYFLQQEGYKVFSVADSYGAFSHARNAALITCELPAITEAAAKQYNLDYPETEGLRVYLYHYLSRVYYVYFSLRHLRAGNAFCWVSGEGFAHGDWSTMFQALACQPIGAMASYAYTDYSTPHYLLTAFYNHVIAFFASRSKRPKVIDFGDELPKRILAAMRKNGDDSLLFNTHRVGRNPFLSTRFFIKSLSRIFSHNGLPVMMFRTASPRSYKTYYGDFDVPKLSSPDITHAVRHTVTGYIAFARTEVRIGRNIVRAIRPDLAVSDHAKYLYILGGLEELKKYGGLHAMLNHGTHTVQAGAISNMAGVLWGSQERIINRNTTHSLPKSPLTAQMLAQVRSDNNYELCKLNVYGRIENKASAEGKFVILQAGNYTDAFNHIPWCKETADEYLLAIVELLEEVGKLDNVELIIKLKNKKADTHKAIVEGHIARLGIADKARVDTTGKFSELMARAHIVVCNVSGTIEEALANNMPVMVHSWRKSYFHIAPEVVDASSIDGLSPAYLVHHKDDIGRIVTKLSARRGELRNPALYKNVAWQESERMPIEELAAKLQAARANFSASS